MISRAIGRAEILRPMRDRLDRDVLLTRYVPKQLRECSAEVERPTLVTSGYDGSIELHRPRRLSETSAPKTESPSACGAPSAPNPS